jgi:hypothetical protein
MFKLDYSKWTPDRLASMFGAWVAIDQETTRPPYYTWKNEIYVHPADGKERVNHKFAYDSLLRMLRSEYFYNKWKWTRAIIYENIHARPVFQCVPNHKKGNDFNIIEEKTGCKSLDWIDIPKGKVLNGFYWFKESEIIHEVIDIKLLNRKIELNDKFWHENKDKYSKLQTT